MNYLTNYYKNLSEQLQVRVNSLEKLLNEESKVEPLPFEILGIDAPLEYGKTNFDPSMIGIYGRHVRPDRSRGPEVIVPVHAFADMHHNDVIDHAEDYMRGKGRRSPDNPLFKALNDQGGDRPTTFNVDPSKIESIESYNKRVEEQQVNILEAYIRTSDEISRYERNPYSDRAFRREETIDAIRGLLDDPSPRVHKDKVKRVLSDAMGIEGSAASREDIQHVMAHIRRDYYLGSEDPEHQRLDAARQRTLERYT